MNNKELKPKLRFPLFNNSWAVYSISNITHVTSGGTPNTLKEEYWNGSIPWMNSGELNLKRVFEVKNRITELGLMKSSTKVIPKKSILIGLAGQGKTRGTIAINMIELCINQSIAAILPNENKFKPEFLYFNLDNRYDELRGLSTGEGGRGGLNLQIIKSLKIVLPELIEQQKIASFLLSVDFYIENLKQQKEALEKYKKGLMQKIFGQQIRFKDQNWKEFPEWEEKKLGEIATFRRGSFPQPYGLPEWYDDVNGEPFVQVFDVDSNMRLKPKTKQKISEAAKSNSVFVEKGTVIITLQGSIGRVALTQYDCYIDRTLLIFQSYKLPIDKMFFTYILELLFDIEKGKAPGGTIKTITKEVLTSFRVKIPSLMEQKKISDLLSSIVNGIDSKQKLIGKAELWKKGLLQQLFI